MKEYLKLFEPLTFSEADDSATEGSLRIKMERTTDEAERNAWAQEIAQLVAERNWGVHKSLLELCDATDAKRNGAVVRDIEYYNLDAIIYVGQAGSADVSPILNQRTQTSNAQQLAN